MQGVIPTNPLTARPTGDVMEAVGRCPLHASTTLVQALNAYRAAVDEDDGTAMLAIESLFAVQASHDREGVDRRLAEMLCEFWANEYRRVTAESN